MVHHHTVEVTVLDSAARPVHVAVFDRGMGYSRDWAQQALGESGAGTPYSATIATMPVVTLLDAHRARPVTVSFAILELTEDGYFQLTVDEPLRNQPRSAPFCSFGSYFPAADAGSIPVTVTAAATKGEWRIRITVDLSQAMAALNIAP